jgi:hypothetical protein
VFTLDPLEIPLELIGLKAIRILSIGILPVIEDYLINILDPLEDNINESEKSGISNNY